MFGAKSLPFTWSKSVDFVPDLVDSCGRFRRAPLKPSGRQEGQAWAVANAHIAHSARATFAGGARASGARGVCQGARREQRKRTRKVCPPVSCRSPPSHAPSRRLHVAHAPECPEDEDARHLDPNQAPPSTAHILGSQQPATVHAGATAATRVVERAIVRPCSWRCSSPPGWRNPLPSHSAAAPNRGRR